MRERAQLSASHAQGGGELTRPPSRPISVKIDLPHRSNEQAIGEGLVHKDSPVVDSRLVRGIDGDSFLKAFNRPTAIA